MFKFFTRKLDLYSWNDQEISSLVAYYTLLRGMLRMTAEAAWKEIQVEVDRTNLEKLLDWVN